MEEDSSFAAPNISLGDAMKAALQPAVLFRSFIASAIIWLIMANISPSYARLVFQGKLSGYFAAGLGIALVSHLVIVLVTSLFSSDHATIALTQSPSAVIQGMIAGSVVAAAPSTMSPETLFAVVVWIIVLSSVLTGCFLLMLGLVRAGGLIRFIPYPIVGGILAGLGFLMVQAGFFVVVDRKVSAESLRFLMDGAVFARWLSAIVLAVFILGLQARYKNVLILPGAIIASLLLFYLGIQVVGGDMAAVKEAGWLLPQLPSSIQWQLPDPGAIRQIDNSMILASVGGIGTLIVVCTLNLFFKASGQEVVVGRELNINRESIVNGMANIASGAAGGGIVGYHVVAFASLVQTMGVNGRLVGVILAFMFGLTLLFGGAIFSLVPRFIPAGLLMYFGLQFLKEWLLDSWSKLPRQDYVTVLVIALAIALFGLLPGIALGLAVASVLFALEYSRMDVIKQELAADIHRSNLDRSFAQNHYLQKEGEKILILRLQGYVFFGTAYRFYEHIQAIISDKDRQNLKFLILDFKSVRGFDVSTIVDFKKLKRLTDRHDIDLLFCSVLAHLQPLLVAEGIVEGKSGRPLLFNDLDHALELCENILLEDANLLGTTDHLGGAANCATRQDR